ncbi:YcaO-like family protein [Tannerella forsythia]|uniref:YcaO-like family protein n=1 Tax=Tannerella forsythia TaxID=28112 RepID=UPI00210C9BFA|nr:YcaO-like family protein [Tannerella forsythia]
MHSLASGYAEFMERLQNNMLLFGRRFATHQFFEIEKVSDVYIQRLSSEGLIFDHYYDSNELYMSPDTLVSKYGKELCKLFNYKDIDDFSKSLQKRFGNKKFICVPFYAVEENKEVYLPVELCLFATGSNGMASGNTPEEAILQSLCEIFERYAISEIYNKGLTPPTIPFEYFEGKSIYNKINYLTKDKGFELIIKDCSLGKKLPVIGVIIIDKQKQLYNFKIASDFVAEIALERCLNELHQGSQTFKSIPLKYYTFEEINNLNGPDSALINLEKIFVNGSGFWPVTIFHKSESYKFIKFDIEYGQSNEKNIKIAKKLIKKNGCNIYIRDNSILGFPTYYIVIPGMSQIDMTTPKLERLHKSESLDQIRYLGNKHINTITLLAEIVNEEYNIIKAQNKSYTKNYIYCIDPDLTDLDLELLGFMLNFYLKDFEKALYYLDIFLSEKHTLIYQYYYAIRDFVDLYHIKNIDPTDIKIMLDLKYSEDLTSELFSDFSNPELVFQYHNFPKGFDFTPEQFDSSTALLPILRIEKEMERYCKENPIQQIKLASIFHS